MIKVTDEMRHAFDSRLPKGRVFDMEDDELDARLAAALAVAERGLRASIAYRIRAELVCCDVYERDHDTDRAGRTHPICFWGEAAARIAEEGSTDTATNAGGDPR